MSGDFESLASRAVTLAALNERCVVSQFRTTSEQRLLFESHLKTCKSYEAIPIEWVIDIADESNGWFYGTAYSFDDKNQSLHIMVPDKVNPSFDGNIPLDFRMVHLVECVDGKTEALFNKIVRDSIIKVKWEVEWFEEGEGGIKFDADSNVTGKWIPSIARYFLRIANQLLVEDTVMEGNGPNGTLNGTMGGHGFVMLTADMSLRLKECIGGRGLEDFNRLVLDGQVQSSKETHENAIISASKIRSQESADNSEGTNVPLRKLAEMSRTLRESIALLLEEREKLQMDKKKMVEGFEIFALQGDLDAAMKVLSVVDESKTPIHMQQEEEWEAATEDAWYLCQRVEKSALKLLKSGDSSGAAAEEVDYLRRNVKTLKRDLQQKEKEVEQLRAQIH